MVLFDKCCCFFRLTTGGVILGWIGAIESLLMVILSLFGLTSVDYIIHSLNATSQELHMVDWNNTAALVVGSSNATDRMEQKDLPIVKMTTQLDDAEMEAIRVGLYIGFTIYLIVNLITLISSSMLITGTILRNSLYLLPWLFGEGICLVVSVVMALLKVVELFVEQINIANGIGFIFFVLIITGVEIYLYLCVYSLYQVLKEENRNRQLQQSEMQQQLPEKDVNDGLPAYSQLS